MKYDPYTAATDRLLASRINPDYEQEVAEEKELQQAEREAEMERQYERMDDAADYAERG